MTSIDALNSVKKDAFKVISMTLGRSIYACNDHWKIRLLPILKTHILGLPQGVEWRNEFLMHLVQNKVTDVKKIEYNLLVEKRFPGQTTRTLASFADIINNSKGDNKIVHSNEPLHEKCSRRLNHPKPNSYLTSERMANSNLTFAEDIVEIYNSLILSFIVFDFII